MFLSIRVVGGLVALAAATALAALVSPTAALVVAAGGGAALLGLVAVDVARAPRAGDLGIRRVAPAVASVGKPATVLVRLRNPTGRPLRMGVRDASPPSLHRSPTRHRARLEAEAGAALEATLVPARRGQLALGPVTARTEGRFGLAGRQSTLPLVDRLKVYPALPGRAEVALRLERARVLQSGERSSAIRGGGTDFDSLREYHHDDEFRRINWFATARSPKPIANVYREERNQQVLVLLDASRMMAASVEGVPRFEHALDGAFAVAQLAARIGDQVGVLAFGREVVAFVGPRSGRDQPRRVLEALFGLEPSLDAPNYRGAFATLLARHRRRALLVLLTELTEISAMESLFSAVPLIVSRHLVMVGSVRDPDGEALARSMPFSSEEAYAKAAAAEAVAAREAAGARLRAMGATVVDARPGALAGRLADQYLRIKAFGRL